MMRLPRFIERRWAAHSFWCWLLPALLALILVMKYVQHARIAETFSP